MRRLRLAPIMISVPSLFGCKMNLQEKADFQSDEWQPETTAIAPPIISSKPTSEVATPLTKGLSGTWFMDDDSSVSRSIELTQQATEEDAGTVGSNTGHRPPPDLFCRSCGAKFLISDQFCGKCGAKR